MKNDRRVPTPGDPVAAIRRPSEASRLDDSSLLALRAEYMTGLPASLAVLRRAVELAERTWPDRADLVAARTLAHTLHGTAGCYGFGRVSAAASEIEQRLADMLDPRHEPSDHPWLEIGARLDEASEGAKLPDRIASSRGPVPVAASTAFAPPRLLVVDDDPEFVRFVRAVAAEQLVEVLGTTSVAQALDALTRFRPDAALIDVTLEPAGTSFQLAQRFAAAHAGGVPVAFASANGDLENRVLAVRAGAGLYVTKPLDEHAMAQVIRQLVAMRRDAPARVLVVDHDAPAAARCAVLLRNAGMLASTHGETARILEALEKTRPDLVLIEAAMPGVDGLDVCRVVRATPRWHDLPILLLGHAPDEDLRVRALRAGADDVIAKSIGDHELVARVEMAAKRAAAWKEAAGTDPLTGLWLRLRFTEELALRLREARRQGRPLALALLDLDGFKAVNDTHGHIAGDRVLSGLASLFRRCLRAEDLRARWGGEEFIVAFAGEGIDAAHDVLTRLIADLASTDFFGETGAAFHVSFSAGLAALPADGDSIESLVKAADRRLYHAKRAGKGRAVRAG